MKWKKKKEDLMRRIGYLKILDRVRLVVESNEYCSVVKEVKEGRSIYEFIN